MPLELSENAKLNQEVLKDRRDARRDWEDQARLDIEFRLGNHYSKADADYLASINQPEAPVDRVGPAIDNLKATLTSNPPKFRPVPREDSDVKMVHVWRTILGYIWDISEGDVQVKQAIDDYATAGLGYLYAYIDTEVDFGRGDVKFTWIDPFRVYVPPSSRDRWFSDAEDLLISTIVNGATLVNMYPQLGDQFNPETGELEEGIVHELETVMEEDYPEAQNKDTINIFTPAEARKKETFQSKYQILERFYPVRMPFYRVTDNRGRESVLDQEAFDSLLQDMPGAIEKGLLNVEETLQTRIGVTATVGEIDLYETVLNTDMYPIIPLPNTWTGTPYPKSDVSRARPVQKLYNKLWSLSLSHAQGSAGLKLLVPEGAVDDVSDLEVLWQNPNAVITFRPESQGGGEPKFPSPTPLAAEFYRLLDMAAFQIDFIFGLPEMMHGFADRAPETARGTQQLASFGSTRPKSKLRDIEFSISRLGRVLYQLAKGHYTFQKMFTLAQPNNDLTKVMVNYYDDVSGAIEDIFKDRLNIGQHDIRVEPGSMLPENKEIEFQHYAQLFQLGIIDDIEVLKKDPNIFDKERILMRKSMLAQAQQLIQQLEEENKRLKGDLQTAERQEVSALKGKELSKFKSALHEILADVESDRKVSAAKLGAMLEIEKQSFAQEKQGSSPKTGERQ